MLQTQTISLGNYKNNKQKVKYKRGRRNRPKPNHELPVFRVSLMQTEFQKAFFYSLLAHLWTVECTPESYNEY